MRSHLDKYPHTAPRFEDLDPRFVAFDRYFESKLHEFREMVKLKG